MQDIVGIVVGRTDLGESDRIVRLLTAAEGRVELVARGARRSKKRFAGVLEPGVKLIAHRSRGRGELSTLVSADVLQLPRAAREDYDRLMMLGYGCELLGALSEKALGAEKLFRLAEAWLGLLEATTPTTASRVALETKALTFVGLAPALRICPVCARALVDEVRFDNEAGGGVHPWCGHGEAVAAITLEVWETLRRTPLLDTPQMSIPKEQPWLIAAFIEHQLGRGLRSRALLQA